MFFGKNPIDHAVVKGRLEILKAFIAAGCDYTSLFDKRYADDDLVPQVLLKEKIS